MSLDNNLWVVFFLTILVMFSTKGQGQQRIEVKKLVEECQILTTTLGELHPDLYRYTPQEQFNAKVDSIVRSLDSALDPIEFYLRIIRLKI